eukprot:COSAG01_NODE_17191_length_1171_cov_3.069963_1_plen_29_part_10
MGCNSRLFVSTLDLIGVAVIAFTLAVGLA